MKNTLREKKKISVFNVILHTFMILMCLCYIIPLLLVISASFTSQEWLQSGKGIKLFPPDFTLDGYRSAFGNAERTLRAYWITFSQAVIGTLISGISGGMIGYALSRSNFRFRKPITAIVFFTMLYGAGMIPRYLVYAQMYHITNTYWVYILPSISCGAWNILVYRTFFKGLPESLFESARLDGAGELTAFMKIAVPLSKPVFASIGFMTLVGSWNNYTTSMIYIRNEKLYTLQYLLQRIIKEADFLKALAAETGDMAKIEIVANVPTENLKFALCVVAAGPMLLVFPFFQKYFSKGLTIGAVKG